MQAPQIFEFEPATVEETAGWFAILNSYDKD